MKEFTAKEKLRIVARTCQLIFKEKQWDMRYFANNGSGTARPHCGSPCCIAGNLTIAAVESGEEAPWAPENSYINGALFEAGASKLRVQLGLPGVADFCGTEMNDDGYCFDGEWENGEVDEYGDAEFGGLENVPPEVGVAQFLSGLTLFDLMNDWESGGPIVAKFVEYARQRIDLLNSGEYD